MRNSRNRPFKITLLFCAAVFAIFSGVKATEARETFNRFDAEIVINENSSVEVTEEILVNVENIDINIIRTPQLDLKDFVLWKLFTRHLKALQPNQSLIHGTTVDARE